MSLKDKGKKLIDEGKFVEAFPILKKATEHTKDDSELWASLAWAALQTEQFEEAVEAYKQTIRLSPRSDWAWRQYANALMQADKLEDAEKALNNAKSLNSDSVWLWRHYASLYRRRKNTMKEIEALETIDLLDELDGNDLNRLGIAHHDQKNYSRALEYYHRSAISLQDPAPLFNMALVFSDPEVSQDVDAADSYRRALELQPDYQPAKDGLNRTGQKLLPLAKSATEAAKGLLSESEYFQYYLNPFEALQIESSQITDTFSTNVIQKAKKRLLQEIELNDERVSWLDNHRIDRSQAVIIDDHLLDETKNKYHAAIFHNRRLLRFLTRGQIDHFLYVDNYFPKDTIELIEKEPEFLQFLSKPFAHQYNLVLARAIDKRLLPVLESLFDGRRYVLPEEDDICFEGASKRVSHLVELVKDISAEGEKRKLSISQLEDILHQHLIPDILNLLPTQFRAAQTEAVAHIRSLAITTFNKHGDSDLSRSILRLCQRFQFKSLELNERLQQDFKTIAELINQERQYEAKLTFGKERPFEITKEGIRDGDDFFPASTIKKLRWGISVSGYIGAEKYDYLFAATNDEGMTLVANWAVSKSDEPSSSKHFNSLIQAALNYLTGPVLEKIRTSLAEGSTETIGPCTLTKDGISFRADGFLFVKQHLIGWADLSTDMRNGQVVISNASQPSVATVASMRDTNNAVLVPIISQIFKESDGPRLPSSSSSKRILKPRSFFFALIGVLLTYLLFSSNPTSEKRTTTQPKRLTPPTSTESKSDSRASQPNRVVEPLPDLRTLEPVEPVNPVRLPIGSAPFRGGIREGRSTLTVDNGTEADALVKVIRLEFGEEMVRNFYIPAGRKFNADELPPGSYVLRVAFGIDWDKAKKRFNFRRSFSETQTFEITERQWREYTEDGYVVNYEASDMRITLHKVLHGNFRTETISEKAFMRQQ